MQVSIEATGVLKRCMTVKIPERWIASEVENRLTALLRNAKIDGFRPGKVPMKLVQRRYGAKVRQEVIGEAIQASFIEALAQKNLRPAGTPAIEPLNSESGQGFAYMATFEVYPEIKLVPIEQLKITKPVCKVTEEDVDRMIEMLRRRQRRWEQADRPAQEGDQLEIDFHGTVEGKTFEGGEVAGFKFELGSAGLLEGFERGLMGTCPSSERILDLVFPEDYHNRDLAGKPVQFKVVVNRVSKPVLPEVNEEFFQRFGIYQGGLAAFREEVRKHMERQRDQSVKNEVKTQVMKALLEANSFDLPTTLVDEEAYRLQQEARRHLLIQGATPEQVEGLQPEMFTSQARQRVALGLIMSEIIQSAGLKVDPAKVRSVVEDIAGGYEDPAKVVKWYYEDHKRLAQIEASVLEEEVVAWVLARAQVEECPTTFDALMNPRQTENRITGNA